MCEYYTFPKRLWSIEVGSGLTRVGDSRGGGRPPTENEEFDDTVRCGQHAGHTGPSYGHKCSSDDRISNSNFQLEFSIQSSRPGVLVLRKEMNSRLAVPLFSLL